MLSKAQKKLVLEELKADLGKAKSAIFSGFKGMTTGETTKLRQKLHKAGVKYKVVKLTLLRRVLNDLGLGSESLNANVPMSVSFSADDELSAAKILNDHAKIDNRLIIYSGILNNELIGSDEVKSLAVLPGKEELRGQLVGVIAGPLRGLVNVLGGSMRGLINVLNAKSKI